MAVTFIHDIEEALIAEIESKMGPGSTTYPTPEYLHVQFVGRAGGRPVPVLAEDQLPAIWIEYLGGGPRRGEIGHQWSTSGVEAFNVLGIVRTTPDIIGAPDNDEAEFARQAEAAIGTFVRRLMLVLLDYNPSVTDGILGYKTNDQRLLGWAYNGITRGPFAIDYSVIIRYESLVTI